MNDNDLVSALNTNLADLHILNVKLHNFHWNVEGMQFLAVHELTEKYYDYVFAYFDDIAERILQLGFKPLATTSAYLENATLVEDVEDRFEPETVIERIIADFKVLLGDARHLVELADGVEDTTTSALCSDHIQWLEKELWILKAMMA